MAQLLGSRYCIESLRNDVVDLQTSVTDVISRVGLVRCQSWKYPDRPATDVDIPGLLEIYSYSEDVEERQVAHVVLLEMVIDRFVLLLHATARFIEQCVSGRPGSSAAGQPTTSSSVGLIVKKYWTKLLQLTTVLHQLQSENKAKSSRISELESSLATCKPTFANEPNNSSRVTSINFSPDHKANSQQLVASVPGRDEYSKASQTIETAFVACESCDLMKRCLRSTGDEIVSLCETIGVVSELAKHSKTVNGLTWFSGSDVVRWSTEQNKDLVAIGRRTSLLRSTVDPLQSQLKEEQKKNKTLTSAVSDAKVRIKLEQDTVAAVRNQYEAKIKELEQSHAAAVTSLDRQKSDLAVTMSKLEGELALLNIELQEKRNRIQQIEESRVSMRREMEERLVRKEEAETLRKNMDSLVLELNDVSTKLKAASIELNKEKSKNSSVVKHTELVQTKQSTLLQRLDELDRSNEELRVQVSELEESRDALLQELDTLKKNRNSDQGLGRRGKKEDRCSTGAEEDLVKELHRKMSALEEELKQSKENERLLVEYPDLHQQSATTTPGGRQNNLNLAGTGDIAVDMKNQVKANGLRIQVLQEENNKLHNAIQKLIKSTSTDSSSKAIRQDAVQYQNDGWMSDAVAVTRAAAEGTRQRSEDQNQSKGHNTSQGEDQLGGGAPIALWKHGKENSSGDKSRYSPDSQQPDYSSAAFSRGGATLPRYPSHAPSSHPPSTKPSPPPPKTIYGAGGDLRPWDNDEFLVSGGGSGAGRRVYSGPTGGRRNGTDRRH